MAIEKDSGPGGLIGPQIPEVQPDEVLVEELPQDPGVFEFDDGSAIIGEYAEEQEIPQISHDSNLAEFMDDSDLGKISSDLTGDIDDDISSRQDWQDTYKRGLEFLGMQYEDRAVHLRDHLALFIHCWQKALRSFRRKRIVRCCLQVGL